MRYNRGVLAAFSLALGAGTSAAAGQSAQASATPQFTPRPAAVARIGGTLRLGKCVNMSNMLEAPKEGEWGRGFEDADIGRIKAAGFTAIRLPARFSAHAQDRPPYTIDPAFLARVRHITDLAVANGLSVIVDHHHYQDDRIFDDPLGEAPRFAQLWRQIAVAFKDEPATVYFELLNEPHGKFTAGNLALVMDPALAAIRQSNPTRLVVYPAVDWDSFDAMSTTSFPNDPNVVPTFHYYDPFNFGGDSAPWMTPPVRNSWGNAADIADLRARLTKITSFMQSTGRVPFVGEYGAPEQRPLAQRENYYRQVSAAFASVGVQSCAWGYTNTYPLWKDPSGWVGTIADGIVTTATVP